jgi:hypothetical protein
MLPSPAITTLKKSTSFEYRKNFFNPHVFYLLTLVLNFSLRVLLIRACLVINLIYGFSILDGFYQAGSRRNWKNNSVILRILTASCVEKDTKSGISYVNLIIKHALSPLTYKNLLLDLFGR